jgi:hypothetical protein
MPTVHLLLRELVSISAWDLQKFLNRSGKVDLGSLQASHLVTTSST